MRLFQYFQVYFHNSWKASLGYLTRVDNIPSGNLQPKSHILCIFSKYLLGQSCNLQDLSGKPLPHLRKCRVSSTFYPTQKPCYPERSSSQPLKEKSPTFWNFSLHFQSKILLNLKILLWEGRTSAIWRRCQPPQHLLPLTLWSTAIAAAPFPAQLSLWAFLRCQDQKIHPRFNKQP